MDDGGGWSARQDSHLHRALIECDRGYKPRCAALHHAPKLAERKGAAPSVPRVRRTPV